MIRSILQLLLLSLFIQSQAVAADLDYYKDLYNSLKNNEMSASLADWRESPYNSEVIVDKIVQSLQSEEEERIFCLALSKLLDDEHVLFLNEYNRVLEDLPPIAKGCVKSSIKKANEFLAQRRENLTNRMKALAITLSEGEDYTPRETFGPSKVVEIDVANGPVFIRGDLQNKQILLSFDDGPNPRTTPELLKILNEQNVQVNFFVTGKNAKAYPEIVAKSDYLFHSVGNHSWDHPNMPRISHRQAMKQIQDTFEQIENILGYNDWFFRFPYGATTRRLKRELKEKDVASFFWNMDTLDWKIRDPEDLLEYSLEQVRDQGKGIILFHDIQPQTIAMMPGFLIALKSMGYEPVVFKQKQQ